MAARVKPGDPIRASDWNELAAEVDGGTPTGPGTINIPGVGSPRRTSGSAPTASPAAPIFHAQVFALTTGPMVITAKLVKTDGTLETATITVLPHLFASPVDWDNVTPPIVVGTIIPVYQGVNIANAQTAWFCCFHFTGTGSCV